VDEKKGMTYAESGVDIDKEIDGIKALVNQLKFKRKGLGAPAGLQGHFTGLIDFGDRYLSLCTDSVGSKLLIANEIKKWDTLGIDCYAMNVNDMICIGAEPLAMVDYIAIDDPEPELLRELGKGLNTGAELSNATLIGGETASLPDIVSSYDLVGCCLGYVKKEDLVDGSSVAAGDVIIGIPSSGLHSNGYTLVRKVIEKSQYEYSTPFRQVCQEHAIEVDAEFLELTLGEVCLIPTKIYVKPILEVLKDFKLKGLVNMTGGGLMNLPRLNRSVDYLVETPLPVLPVFKAIQVLGDIEEREMYRTFNMGMGFCVICPEGDCEEVLKRLKVYEPGSEIVGKVEDGSGVARHVPLDLEYGSL
jgi:phosphoribosylformylglycinamidine cyclo-ligase